jgi:hypothetical protein
LTDAGESFQFFDQICYRDRTLHEFFREGFRIS